MKLMAITEIRSHCLASKGVPADDLDSWKEPAIPFSSKASSTFKFKNLHCNVNFRYIENKNDSTFSPIGPRS